MLVGSVLDDNMAAATMLARVAHEQVVMDAGSKLQEVNAELDLDDLGVWIDPIGKYSSPKHSRSILMNVSCICLKWLHLNQILVHVLKTLSGRFYLYQCY